MIPASNAQDAEFLIGCELNERYDITSESGELLHLIASFSLDAIARILGTELPEHLAHGNKRLYGFSYFNQDEYFLDHISYYGTSDEPEFFAERYTRGIIADEGAFKFTTSPVYAFENAGQETDDEVSFVGGEPEFLQNEDCEELEGYAFIGQIIGYDLPEELEDLFYLTSNIGYFFIRNDFSEGLFFVQGT